MQGMHTAWHGNQIWGLLMLDWKKETSRPLCDTLGSSSELKNVFITWLDPKLSWPLQKKNLPYTPAHARPNHPFFFFLFFFVVVQQTPLPPQFSQNGFTHTPRIHGAPVPSFKRHFFEYIFLIHPASLGNLTLQWMRHIFKDTIYI